MKHLILLALFIIPLSLSAQTIEELQARIAALVAQIAALQGSPQAEVVYTQAACPAISRTLARGVSGGDVTALQEFLRARNHMQAGATGFFGPLTETAVRAFQSAEGVVSSGDAASTGFGVVGERTRAAIVARCGTAVQTTASPAPTCPAVSAPPAIACAGTWQRLMSGACHTGWRCMLSGTGNQAPIVDAIDGPSTLALGQGAVWQIVARDPEGTTLSYNVTWGDEGAEDILRSLAGFSSNFVSSPAPSHAYAKPGRYTMRIDVRDARGAVTSATHVVDVANTAAYTASSSSFLPPKATATTKKSCITPWGAQVIGHGQASFWQPFFTEGAYFQTPSSPVVKCEDGAWLKCSAAGTSCQIYTHPTSTAATGLRSYANVIGTPCSSVGTTTTVTVPPGTQLCQWLSCTVTTEARAVTLRCMDGGWSDYQSF